MAADEVDAAEEELDSPPPQAAISETMAADKAVRVVSDMIWMALGLTGSTTGRDRTTLPE